MGARCSGRSFDVSTRGFASGAAGDRFRIQRRDTGSSGSAATATAVASGFRGLADSLGSEHPEIARSIAARTDPAGELPDLRTIAGLTLTQIRSVLSNFDLMRIIRAVDYPFAGKERLEYFDRDTLERVVCLVRRWSQQRLGLQDVRQVQSLPELFEELRRPA